MQILNARPAGMPFEKYREHLRRQKQWLKNRLKGVLVYKASELYDFDATSGSYKFKRNFPPFVGDASKLKPV